MNTTTVCPEICKKCQYYWELVLDNYKIPIDDDDRYGDYVLNEIRCVDIHFEYSPFGNYKVVVNPLPIFENKFRLDKEIFTHCYEDCCLEYYSTGSKKIILKPEIITDKLREACKNVFVTKDECPYYMEHQIEDWNEHRNL